MKIVKSAIKYKDEIHSGYNHEECLNELFKKHDKNSINSKEIEQGFLTSDNEFVDRIQATIIAETSGQLAINLKAGVDPLMSEDMHICWLHEKDAEICELKAHIHDMEQEQIAIMKEHEEFMKQEQEQIEQLEEENKKLKKQNSFMYQQGLAQGKFDKDMEQEYGKS